MSTFGSLLPPLCFDSLPSTNTYLKAHREELSDGSVVIARTQTEGKGRMGRSWETEGQSAWHLSFLCKSPALPVTLLPLLCAVAAAEAIEAVTGVTVGIKWPNDLIAGGKKVGGILCEGVSSGDSHHIVCGIGINVNQTSFPDDLPHAVSLRLLAGRSFARRDLTRAFYEAWAQVGKTYTEDGFASLRETYRARLVHLGQTVRLLHRGESVQAMAVDIDGDGALVCRKEDGQLLTLCSGEISVRGLYGYL